MVTSVLVKSVPAVALPPANVKVTVVAVVLALLKLTSNVALSPSETVGLLIADTAGRSSSAGRSGGVTLPSSLMVAVPVIAFSCVAVFPLSVKLSLPSYTSSSVVFTDTLNVVVLAGTSTLKVPSSFTETGLLTPLMITDTDVPLKSTFLVALSPANVNVTVVAVVLALLKLTSNVAL
ncbi:hypothetical protein VCSRO60_0949 [Vibrio cholerae]|nr:hypothetical protein VCSRO60_0949 [Vibrio cholerae]GHX83790.1 hypothetical protein VCSRO67_0001 [Vibrio cholerae]GIB28346.1 hypothetical protein VCSRO44_0505 [Vibrio cholerae]